VVDAEEGKYAVMRMLMLLQLLMLMPMMDCWWLICERN
jgi:hypothetical protein